MTAPDLAQRILAALPADSVTTLADALHVTRPEVSRALGWLRDNDIVQQVPPERDADKRPVTKRGRWVLTPLGRAIMADEIGIEEIVA